MKCIFLYTRLRETEYIIRDPSPFRSRSSVRRRTCRCTRRSTCGRRSRTNARNATSPSPTLATSLSTRGYILESNPTGKSFYSIRVGFGSTCIALHDFMTFKTQIVPPRGQGPQALSSFRCEICGRKFTQSSHLQQHNRVHSGDKNYRFC